MVVSRHTEKRRTDITFFVTSQVADLKRELKARNLSCSGTKAELAERLRSVVGGGDEAFGEFLFQFEMEYSYGALLYLTLA